MSGDASISLGAAGSIVFVVAATLSFALIRALLPLLQRHALAHPNARTSHTAPTPQGGGIGVVAATLVTAAVAAVMLGDADASLWLVFATVIFVAIVGAIDDVSPIPVLPRFFLQTMAVAIILAALPGELRVVPSLPYWLERLALGVGILYFVNVVNFMDGIDWMTVAEVVPVSAALTIIGAITGAPVAQIILALALCGAIIGFAPLNRPVARLFLGDVGSLAIGLLLAWLLVELAARGYVAAALLLSLYYLADATITLFRRAARGEPVWRAHRMHFYQRAVQNGSTVISVVRRVFLANIGLAVLAVASVQWKSPLTQMVALLAGAAIVAQLLKSLVTAHVNG
jgi:UDP-N-acetylmuramyl pentapeptide phosphotransferase/UDP-N-acetylglucosamine-1-phosphate transferase